MARTPRFTFTRLFVLSLLLLLAVVGYSRAMHPLVSGFGLAHARLLESSGPPVLVVDNLTLAQAPLVQDFSSAVIWGRSAFRVHEILLPWLLLVLAATLLSGLAPHGLSSLAAWWRRPRGRAALPRPQFFLALLLGGFVGDALTPAIEGGLDLAFLPLALGTLWVAGLLSTPRPKAERLTTAFVWLGAARWFGLGCLLFMASSTVAGSETPPELREMASRPSVGALFLCALAFVALHWATRRPSQVDLHRYRGDRESLERECNRLTLSTIGELWILLPSVIVTILWQPCAVAMIADLGAYLCTSALCTLLMKWTLEGNPPQSERMLGRLFGSLSRVATAVGILLFPVFFVSGDFRLWEFPTMTWLVLLALGAVRGRPWASRQANGPSSPADDKLASLTQNPRAKINGLVRGVAALLACASLVLVWSSLDSFENASQASHLYQDTRHAALRTQLDATMGHSVRVLENDGKLLILGCSLDADQWELVQGIVARSRSGQATASVSVSPQRWELAGILTLGLTALAALATLVSLLAGWSFGPRTERSRCFWAVMGGFNGAFALGSWLGWFWLDPIWHWAGWLVCTAMVWPGMLAACRHPDALTTSPAVSDPQPISTTRQMAKVDVLTMEIGRGLLSLVAPKEGAHLLARVSAIRPLLLAELGVAIPGVRILDNLTLDPTGYRILLRGVQVAVGRVATDRFLAVGPASKIGCLGVPVTSDPTYGMPAAWIESQERSRATDLGCIVFDPVSVVATQITETCRRHMPSLVTLETVDRMLEELAVDFPVTVKLVREAHSLVALRNIYRGLLAERVSIRDQESLLNALAGVEGSPEQLIALCRVALGRAICDEVSDSDRVLRVVEFDQASERDLLQAMSASLSWHGHLRQQLESCLEHGQEHCLSGGRQAVLLTHPRLRSALGELMSRDNLGWTVLSRAEVPIDCSLEVLMELNLQTP